MIIRMRSYIKGVFFILLLIGGTVIARPSVAQALSLNVPPPYTTCVPSSSPPPFGIDLPYLTCTSYATTTEGTAYYAVPPTRSVSGDTFSTSLFKDTVPYVNYRTVVYETSQKPAYPISLYSSNSINRVGNSVSCITERTNTTIESIQGDPSNVTVTREMNVIFFPYVEIPFHFSPTRLDSLPQNECGSVMSSGDLGQYLPTSVGAGASSASVVRPRNSDIIDITQPKCIYSSSDGFWKSTQTVDCTTYGLSADGRTGVANYHNSQSSSGWGVSLLKAAVVGTVGFYSGDIVSVLGDSTGLATAWGDSSTLGVLGNVATGYNAASTLAAVNFVYLQSVSGPSSAFGTVEGSNGLGVGTWTWSPLPTPTITATTTPIVPATPAGPGVVIPTPATLDANTVTNTGGAGKCSDGYYLATIPGGSTCVQNGYTSCSSVGYPNSACPNTSQCAVNNGTIACKTQTSTCADTSGSVCTSGTNSCGMSSAGKFLCDGTTCSALVPSDYDCAPPSISLSQFPALINPNNVCTISWSVTNATACSLSSDIGDSVAKVSLPTGSYNSPPLTVPSTYTMLCHDGKVVTNSVSVKCSLNPQYKEI